MVITEKSIFFTDLYLLQRYARKNDLFLTGFPPFIFALNDKLEVMAYYVEDCSG